MKVQAKQGFIEGAWVRDVSVDVDDTGRIRGIERGARIGSGALDMLLPAPLSLHSHAFQRAMAGLTETRGPDPRDSFWTWRRLMYRFLERLTPEHVEAIAAQVFMEMLEAGYGAVAEFHYLHHGPDGTPYGDIAEMAGRVLAAGQETGLGMTLLPVLYSYGGCDGRALTGGQRRFGNDPDRFSGLFEASEKLVAQGRADDGIGVAPHSLRAVDPDGLSQAVALAGARPIHMHLAEQVAEVEEVLAHRGARPAAWLLDNHAVDTRWCLVHCTQMTGAETRALARSGAVAGLCPITESSLGDGIFNGTEFLAASGRFGVGSDSNIHISLFQELATLEYSQRLRDRSRAALATADRSTGRVLFEGAARGGAQAGGRGSGQIAEGQWADMVGVETGNAWICNRTGDAALDSMIFGGRGQDSITDVWSAGRHVVRGGRHIRREAITARFLDVMAGLGQDI